MGTSGHSWQLPMQDAVRLAAKLEVDPSTIAIKRTRATIPAPLCSQCRRKIGLLDIAMDALRDDVHSHDFLKIFFQGGDITAVASKAALDRVDQVTHRIVCCDCGEVQAETVSWFGMAGVIWRDDNDDDDDDGDDDRR